VKDEEEEREEGVVGSHGRDKFTGRCFAATKLYTGHDTDGRPLLLIIGEAIYYLS
jgi:hypothetical protein